MMPSYRGRKGRFEKEKPKTEDYVKMDIEIVMKLPQVKR